MHTVTSNGWRPGPLTSEYRRGWRNRETIRSSRLTHWVWSMSWMEEWEQGWHRGLCGSLVLCSEKPSMWSMERTGSGAREYSSLLSMTEWGYACITHSHSGCCLPLPGYTWTCLAYILTLPAAVPAPVPARYQELGKTFPSAFQVWQDFIYDMTPLKKADFCFLEEIWSSTKSEGPIRANLLSATLQ